MILPWTSVAQIHSATTRDEFLDWLRYRAIDFGMPSAFIDCVDDLRSCEDARDEVKELEEELDITYTEHDALRDAVRSLLKALNLGGCAEFEAESAQGVINDLRP